MKSKKSLKLKRHFNKLMNIEGSLSLKGKSYTFKPIRLGVLLVAFFALMTILIQLLSIPSKIIHEVDMDLGIGGDYTIKAFGKGALLYNNQGIKEVDQKGRVLWESQLSMSQPMVETQGDYIVLADLKGGKKVYLYNKGELKQEFNVGGDIISAKVNQDGDVVIASAATGYKGRVTVFDKRGRERFSWHSGEGYITDVAINQGGRYAAVAQLISNGPTASTRIQFIDLGRKEAVSWADKENSVITQIRFSGNRLLAVSDSELCSFSKNGKQKLSVSFAGKRPSLYDISQDDLFAFVVTDNRGSKVIELYSSSGKLKGSYNVEGNISDISACEKGAMFSSGRNIMYINKRGKLKNQVSSQNDIHSFGLCSDGKTVIAIGTETTEFVRMY